jgi:hypothetical protein
MIAGWFLKQEQKERALAICKKTEEMAEYIFNPSDGVFAMLDIVRFYTLLESVADANRVCDASIPFVAKITVPTEKATAILKIAETLSMLSMRFRDKTDVSRLVQLKKLILSVDPIIAKHDSDKTKINSSNLDSDSVSSLGSDLADHFEVEILSWAQIRLTRDTLLCNLVRHQVWFVVESRISLDEVWSTIHDINDDELRDNAIIAAVNMLCLMGSLDEANDWADFISNAEKKKDTIKKIKTKSKESKKQIEINSDTNYTEAGKAIGFALEQPLHVVALPCSALRILKRLQHSTNYLFVNNS